MIFNFQFNKYRDYNRNTRLYKVYINLQLFRIHQMKKNIIVMIMMTKQNQTQ